MNRRSFISRLAGAAAIIALAPQLAFRTKPLQIPVPAPAYDDCGGTFCGQWDPSCDYAVGDIVTMNNLGVLICIGHKEWPRQAEGRIVTRWELLGKVSNFQSQI